MLRNNCMMCSFKCNILRYYGTILSDLKWNNWVFIWFARSFIFLPSFEFSCCLQKLALHKTPESFRLCSLRDFKPALNDPDGSNRSKSLGVRAMFGRNARHNAVKLKLSLKCSHYSQIGTTNIFFLKYHQIHTKIFHCVRNNI